MDKIDLQFVDEAVRRHGTKPDAVIPILQALQGHYQFLPEEAMRRVCQLTEIAPSAISGVASFYGQFRLSPVGQHRIHVCQGTACHVSGADRLYEELRRFLKIPHGKDTDEERRFTVEGVACLGCCTLAPVVQMNRTTYGYLNVEKLPATVAEFLESEARQREPGRPVRYKARKGAARPVAQIQIGLGSCCVAKGSGKLLESLQESIERAGADVVVKRVGCVGMCHRTPLIEVTEPGKAGAFYSGLNPEQTDELVRTQFPASSWLKKAAGSYASWMDRLLFQSDPAAVARNRMGLEELSVAAFLGKQCHIATEHFGKIDPLDVDEYVAHDGFKALEKCLDTIAPEQVVQDVIDSGLRGRGGGGFPTGQKWTRVRAQADPVRYVICNGDEGDPGAFMDRMLLESFPYRIIEGMAIAAYAVGSHEGIFYIRQEYPLAVQRIRQAIETCEDRGWLGEKLLGREYRFKVCIKEGAGAFVCGEETALIESLEGKRGMPQLRPPFPAESGLWGKPTLVNNVETLALLPWIVRQGPAAFASIGTATSKGTKVFALAGKVRRGGLIEVPMGTTLREIVQEIGGGVPEGRRFKAVQIGGPSGGCLPAHLADLPVEYESLREAGAVMGSGGLIVLDDSDCMVDIARYFLQFTQNQSCGKCTFCRIGTRRLLDILEKICAGKGRREHLTELERLSKWVGQGSLCGLGKTAPNPIVTTLKYFRDEYEAHLDGRCPAGKCAALIRYEVKDNCIGCTICAQRCPTGAIELRPHRKHEIETDKCSRCDSCRLACPHDAIMIVS